jgi:hypothetical protein
MSSGTDGIKKWIAVLRAADAAARWHVHQRRKGILTLKLHLIVAWQTHRSNQDATNSN